MGGMAVGLVFRLISPLQSYVQEAASPLLHTSAQVSWDPDLDGATWVFDSNLKPDQVRKFKSLDSDAVEGAEHLARSFGGVRVSESGFSLRIRLVLRGARGEPTLIEGMKADSLECVPAPTAGIMKHGLEGGGEIQSLAVDLDHGKHDAKAVLKDGSLDPRPYFSKNFYELDEGESVVYEGLVLTRRQCRWRLAVQVRSGETTGPVHVDDVGAPFLASSVVGSLWTEPGALPDLSRVRQRDWIHRPWGRLSSVTGEQLDGLRPIASYDTETQTWHARLGVLDLAGVQMLQALFDAARVHGTAVCLTPVAVPARAGISGSLQRGSCDSLPTCPGNSKNTQVAAMLSCSTTPCPTMPGPWS
ncbi:hypothetical protein RFN58_42060 [Streptomyces iakyrus]|uniref:hypothetical protein n=1 Tax=Streptomyces iakyrus TaxID=68219 RepID=UPI0012FEA3CF|nr:hypothetical protein [Streptomyces iakyrus]